MLPTEWALRKALLIIRCLKREVMLRQDFKLIEYPIVILHRIVVVVVVVVVVVWRGGGDVSSELRRFAIQEGTWRKKEDQQQQHKLELPAQRNYGLVYVLAAV